MCCKIVEAQSCTSVCFSKCCLTMTLRPSSLLRLGWRALWESTPTRAWLHFSTPPFWTSMIKMRFVYYKVPSYCSLFGSTALFPGGKLSPNVGITELKRISKIFRFGLSSAATVLRAEYRNNDGAQMHHSNSDSFNDKHSKSAIVSPPPPSLLLPPLVLSPLITQSTSNAFKCKHCTQKQWESFSSGTRVHCRDESGLL